MRWCKRDARNLSDVQQVFKIQLFNYYDKKNKKQQMRITTMGL